MERAFGTLQSRLPPELRLAGIATVEAANRFLEEQFVPDYNVRFAVPAAEPGSAFIPYAGRPLEEILCVQESRQVGFDNCVTWKGIALQIPPQPHRHHYVKASVRVHESRTAGSPSSTGRAAWSASIQPASPSMPWPLNSARRPGLGPDGFVDNAARCPQPQRPYNNSSGHLMRCDRRTSSRATDTEWRRRLLGHPDPAVCGCRLGRRLSRIRDGRLREPAPEGWLTSFSARQVSESSVEHC